MIGSLLWKEWREHRWKLAAAWLILLAPLAGHAFYAYIRGRPINELPVQDVQFATTWGLTIWIAALTITSERDTRPMLEGLPTRLALIFALKSFFGLVTLLVPVCVAKMLTDVLLNLPFDGYWTTIVAYQYLLILAVGMGIRREGAAAMVGVLILLASIIAVGVLASHGQGWENLARWLLPLYSANDSRVPAEISQVHLAECGALWLIACLRFVHGPFWHRSNPRSASIWHPASVTRLQPRSRLATLIWKEWREQRGILVGAAAAGFAITVVIAFTIADPHNFRNRMDDLRVTFLFMGVAVPLIVAIVLGISGWTFDLDPAIATFWQSRPLCWSRVFWIKYIFAVAGILILATAFFASAYFCVWYSMHGWHDWPEFYWGSTELTHAFLHSVIWCPLLLTFTMLAQILIRRPIYVGTLAAAACAGVAMFRLSGTQREQQRWDHWLPILTLALLLITGALAIAAGKSLQKNWRFTT